MKNGGGVREFPVLLFDYSRGRQALLSVTQPALGALLAAGAFPSLRVSVLGLTAATAGFLCVFAANDLFDRRADRQALETGGDAFRNPTRDVDVVAVRHPLAAGVLPLWVGVGWVAATGGAGFLAAWLLRPLCAFIFLACLGLEFLYCALKTRSWLKTVPAGVMVGLGGLAGWFAVGGSPQGALAFFFLLTVWEIAGRNLSNDLADASTDAPLGITTVATIFGPRTSARWILAGALAMPAIAAFQTGGAGVRVALAAGAVGLMTLPAIRLARRTSEAQALAYFNVASLYPAAAFALTAVFVVA